MPDPLAIPGRILPVILHVEGKTSLEIEQPRRCIIHKDDRDIIGSVIEEIARDQTLRRKNALLQKIPLRRDIEYTISGHTEKMDTHDQITPPRRIIQELYIDQ